MDSKKDDFLNLIENLNEGIFITDLKGNITFANNTLLKMLNLRKEDILNKNYLNFNSRLKTPLEKNRRKFNSVIRKKEPLENDIEFRKTDNTTINMTISIFPKVINGKVTGTYGKITDITEKKKLEHKLHKTINYLQNIVNSVNDAIIVSDNKGNRYLLNNKAKQVDKLLFNLLAGRKPGQYLVRHQGQGGGTGGVEQVMAGRGRIGPGVAAYARRVIFGYELFDLFADHFF